jgi:hypothetical protein
MSDATPVAGEPGGLSADDKVRLIEQADEARQRTVDPSHPIYGANPVARNTRLAEIDAVLLRAGLSESDWAPPTAREIAAATFERDWRDAAAGPSEAAQALVEQHLALAAALPGYAQEAEVKALRQELGDADYNRLIGEAEEAVKAGLFPGLKALPPAAFGNVAALRTLAVHARQRRAYEQARQQAKFL